MLAVSDDGSGMDTQTLGYVFEPFFTTKARGRGTGLGLATVYGIVKQNEGFISVHSELGQGTTFKIYVPPVAEPAMQAAIGLETTEPEHGVETVLVVEDEPSLLQLTARHLKRLGYTVLTADAPLKALELAREHPSPIHLVLTDVVMPEMSGRELFRKLAELRPGLKSLFMSGYTADTISRDGVLDPDVHFLEKPFTVRGLAAKLREAIED